MYIPKDTCRAEVTSNSEKIKSIVLAVIELHLPEGMPEGISQSGSQSSRKIH